MPKVLSKSGDSLADVYDVKGSIAGIDELLSADVNLIHEMGATLFSERLAARIIRVTAGAIAQSVSFASTFTVLENSRILGAQIIVTDSARLSRVQLSITSPPNINDQDIPIVAWEAGDPTVFMSLLDAGVGSTFEGLSSLISNNVPSLLVGSESESPVNLLTIRGIANAFGAGTVTAIGIVHLGFSQPGGLSNRGLPLPSW